MYQTRETSMTIAVRLRATVDTHAPMLFPVIGEDYIRRRNESSKRRIGGGENVTLEATEFERSS